MKNSLLLFALLLLSVKSQAQNFLYIGDESYPASGIQYFTCKSCGWNSYQAKQRQDLSKYRTLEFQTGGNEEHFFVRISVNPQNIRSGNYTLQDKISIFFENGERVVLLKPIYREKIDEMQELFFELSQQQTFMIQNKSIKKIQYGGIHPYDNKNTILADAIPFRE